MPYSWWTTPEHWVAACYVCGHFVYQDDEHGYWLHLHYDGFTITHIGSPGGHPTEPTLLIQEEP